MQRYNPKEVEPKWQKIWADQKTYEVTEDPSRTKCYVIDMFPYPSGAGLHLGHVRNFTISDTIAQFQRQKGKNVLRTIGWDAFGSPAENYAIKTGTPPAESIKVNIASFKDQLHKLGMSYDWSREINTTDPEYYRWTQWIFLQLFNKGLAYQAVSAQWWCNECKTVLANEQVVNGCCWRHEDLPVVKKNLKQWFFKITAYADALLDGIDDLSWPEKIKTMQRNWIGRSKGALVRFQVNGAEATDKDTASNGSSIEVFTTRPDTIFGATFLVLAPEHAMVSALTTAEQQAAVVAYIAEAQSKGDVERMDQNRDKTGVFTGSYAINPATKEQVPIWIADYVLTGYGTGAIMAVPAHDKRDHAFAQQYQLPIKAVVAPSGEADAELYVDEGVMINSGAYDGLASAEAREKIVSDLAQAGAAEEKVNYRMRDWLISRQRYWGAPIPIVHCEKDGAVAIPEDQLPVRLPEVASFQPTGGEKSVLAEVDEWVNTTCPKCGGPAKRETDTMDGYACSSWYFLRYIDPKNDQRAWDPEKANYWMPVDYYCGGDHAVSHLLYTRFWFHFFADEGLIEPSRREPVGRLVYNGYINAADGAKMSKSKGNVINPNELIEQGYGADSLRVFELFIAPYEQDAAWNTNGVPGCYRFLNRVWTLVQEYADYKEKQGGNELEAATTATNSAALLTAMHRTIKRVSHDLEELSFNTAIAALMEGVNELYKLKAEAAGYSAAEWGWALRTLIQLLAPLAPHISEELWQQLSVVAKNDADAAVSVHFSGWPVHDEKYLVTDTVTIVVQVNGKLRANISVAKESDQATIEAEAKKAAQKYLDGLEVKKTIYVPNKIVNFVV